MLKNVGTFLEKIRKFGKKLEYLEKNWEKNWEKLEIIGKNLI
jgi:hypothetical protein